MWEASAIWRLGASVSVMASTTVVISGIEQSPWCFVARIAIVTADTITVPRVKKGRLILSNDFRVHCLILPVDTSVQ
jgi:hypothetical protein